MKRIYWQSYKGGFWIRVFGYGISVADRRIHPALFSERNGFKKPLKVGPYAIGYLHPQKKEQSQEATRFTVSDLEVYQSPVYPWHIKEHLNANQTQDGVKMRLVQMLPKPNGFTVVWEKDQ
jgi:hypothetical protein